MERPAEGVLLCLEPWLVSSGEEEDFREKVEEKTCWGRAAYRIGSEIGETSSYQESLVFFRGLYLGLSTWGGGGGGGGVGWGAGGGCGGGGGVDNGKGTLNYSSEEIRATVEELRGKNAPPEESA